jgi:hypothetical protein
MVVSAMSVAGDMVAGDMEVGVGAASDLDLRPEPWSVLRLPVRTTEVGTDTATAIHTDMAMMTTTRMRQLIAMAMRRFPTAMATHPTEFTDAT